MGLSAKWNCLKLIEVTEVIFLRYILGLTTFSVASAYQPILNCWQNIVTWVPSKDGCCSPVQYSVYRDNAIIELVNSTDPACMSPNEKHIYTLQEENTQIKTNFTASYISPNITSMLCQVCPSVTPIVSGTLRCQGCYDRYPPECHPCYKRHLPSVTALWQAPFSVTLAMVGTLPASPLLWWVPHTVTSAMTGTCQCHPCYGRHPPSVTSAMASTCQCHPCFDRYLPVSPRFWQISLPCVTPLSLCYF